MRAFIRTLMFLTPWMISGCQYDPYAGDYTTKQPKREDVIGVYQFKDQTISQASIDKLGQKATIVLNSDGSYQANNIPDLFGGADAESHKHSVEPSCQNIDVEPGFDYKLAAWENCFRFEFDKKIGTILYLQYSNEYKLYKRTYSEDFGKENEWVLEYDLSDLG